MEFVFGFLIWLALGLAAGFVVRLLYPAPLTTTALALTFGTFGAFIGGMLGMSAYVFMGPEPLQLGGILGAALGAVFFVFLYHFIGRHYA